MSVGQRPCITVARADPPPGEWRLGRGRARPDTVDTCAVTLRVSRPAARRVLAATHGHSESPAGTWQGEP